MMISGNAKQGRAMLISANKLLIQLESDIEDEGTIQYRDTSYNIIHRLKQVLDKNQSSHLHHKREKIVSFEIAKHLFLIKIIKQVEHNYQNSRLSAELIAKRIAVSERQIYRIFKDYLNISPCSFIKIYRLEKALLHIKRGESLGNIAYSIGFSSHSYFSHCFKSRFGKTPTEFVKLVNHKNRQEFNNAWQDTDKSID